MPDQIQKPLIEKPGHKQVHDEGGPKIPNISKPDGLTPKSWTRKKCSSAKIVAVMIFSRFLDR
jgi:hypothetical protein